MSEWIVKQNPDGQLEVVGELIRCKDCKHWDGRVYYCEVIDDCRDWKADDYCSLAERKEIGRRNGGQNKTDG